MDANNDHFNVCVFTSDNSSSIIRIVSNTISRDEWNLRFSLDLNEEIQKLDLDNDRYRVTLTGSETFSLSTTEYGTMVGSKLLLLQKHYCYFNCNIYVCTI